MINKTTKKGLKDCEIINYWSNSISLMRILKKEDDLFLDELFLLSLVFRLWVNKGSPVHQVEITQEFNVLSYKRDKMMNNLIMRGFIKNDAEGLRTHFKPHKIIVTPLGEQLLIKYNKAMLKLCEG